MSTEERITAIERRLARYQRISWLALACLGLVVLLGMEGGCSGSGTVRAQRFILVDSAGNELGEWRVDGSSSRLDMRSGEEGRGLYVAVDNSPDGLTGVALYGHGNRATLGIYENSPGVGGRAALDRGNNDERAKIMAGNGLAPKLVLKQEAQVRVRAEAAETRSSVAVVGSQQQTLEVPPP